MSTNAVFIAARDLPDAWFQAVTRVLDLGRIWTVERGSYVGQKRWEFDHVTIYVAHPGTRPLVPETPLHMPGVPPPTTQEYVDDYLPYLMTDAPPRANEAYTYGERIVPQMERIIERFKQHRGSNQECIAVARPEDIELDDPPCLRSIDCRIYPDSCRLPWERTELNFVVYFGSNDLWGGFPANMAAIRLMQEYMADCIGVEAGDIVYSSKGLHLYEHVFDIAKQWVRS